MAAAPRDSAEAPSTRDLFFNIFVFFDVVRMNEYVFIELI